MVGIPGGLLHGFLRSRDSEGGLDVLLSVGITCRGTRVVRE